MQAVKIAIAMGAEVTVISTSDKKREEALGHLGAQHFLISKDEAAMKVRNVSCPEIVTLCPRRVQALAQGRTHGMTNHQLGVLGRPGDTDRRVPIYTRQ